MVQVSAAVDVDQDVEDPYTALLVDYAAGGLSSAERLIVRTHAAMRPTAATLIADAEIVGGLFLENLEPAPMACAPLAPNRPMRRRRPNRRDTLEARVALALTEPDALRWGWLAPGIRRHRLPLPGASFLRVASGREAPQHDHAGQELTLVLRGELVDEAGVHKPGDIVFAGPGHAHAPRAEGHEDCVCLISISGGWRLSSWTQRLAARVFAS